MPLFIAWGLSLCHREAKISSDLFASRQVPRCSGPEGPIEAAGAPESHYSGTVCPRVVNYFDRAIGFVRTAPDFPVSERAESQCRPDARSSRRVRRSAEVSYHDAIRPIVDDYALHEATSRCPCPYCPLARISRRDDVKIETIELRHEGADGRCMTRDCGREGRDVPLGGRHPGSQRGHIRGEGRDGRCVT